jgi:tRNA A-37 threonylcarbamoyl transferase component Bud32
MTTLQPGQMLGPYQIISQIGQGGMATVYKAYHASIDRYVALKVVSAQLAEDPDFLKRFQQEARLIAKLEHPHILPVHDFGEFEGTPYMVMRFLEAGTLKERLAAPISLAEVDRIFTQLANALQYAHDNDVIHRDIKPSNAMLDKLGDIYLTDFGVAKILEGTAKLTATGTITGTPAYMSPEQARGDKADQRSDIYSLGVVLFEMLTGHVPFEAETPMAVLFKQIQDPPPPLSIVRPDLPYTFEPVLLKALAKDPAERYASIHDFLDAWKRAYTETGNLAAAPIAPTPAPVPETKKAADVPARRPNWIIIGIGIGIVAIACALLFAFILRPRILANRPVNGTNATQLAPAAPSTFPRPGLIDDFEGSPPPGTAGWQPFFQDGADTQLTCATDRTNAKNGSKALQFKYDAAANSWVTCGFYYDAVQDWSAGEGIAFYLRADQAGLLYDINLYGGSPGGRTTYLIHTQTPPESVKGWTLIRVRWNELLRAEWEDNPGTPFNPAEVTGFAFGLGTSEKSRSRGNLWVDDLQLINAAK